MVYTIFVTALLVAQAPPPAKNGADCGSGITCYPCLSPDETVEVDPRGYPSSILSTRRTQPSCSTDVHPGQCVAGKDGKISSTKVASFAECCTKCTTEASCVAWTFYEKDKTPTCDTFSDPARLKEGQCTAGYVTPPPNPSPSPGPSPSPTPPTPPPGPACKDCPNIVLMFTDDQDLTIGGWDNMDQTKKLIQNKGAYATNWTIHTPICGPSRSELLSGRYFHSIKNAAQSPPAKLCGSGAVGHVDLENKVYPFTFAQALRVQKGYHTGLFGKCMNGGCLNPRSMNGAFERWFEGTNYQGGSFYDNESPNNKFNVNDYAGGYGTSVIGNKTVEWIKNVTAKDDGRPFFIFFAPHAPHSPATPAKWYESACANTKSPRNPAYNYTSPLFHNLVARQPPITDKEATSIDTLARKRCQTLLSVDDSYAGIHNAVVELGLESKTYFLVTSDHGYNLGQHRLPSNKFLLYDHSLRIPMLFKGPGITAGSNIDFYGTNVDVAPTILGMAGISTPSAMDGKSIVPLLVTSPEEAPASVRRHLSEFDGASAVAVAVPARNYSFHEYYNQGPWEVDVKSGAALDDWSNTYIGLYGRFQTHPNLLKYAEYDAYGKQSNFTSVYLYELFDLVTDPYELDNIYAAASDDLKQELHTAVHTYYKCGGPSCI